MINEDDKIQKDWNTIRAGFFLAAIIIANYLDKPIYVFEIIGIGIVFGLFEIADKLKNK